jgi:hypothetical protein
MEILLGTNAECNSDIFLDFFLRNFSYGKKIKFLRMDFDPSYLRIGTL